MKLLFCMPLTLWEPAYDIFVLELITFLLLVRHMFTKLFQRHCNEKRL